MNYSDMLGKYVKDSGLSLSEISKRMNERGMKIDKSYISKLQNGMAKPLTTEMNMVLAEALGGDPEQLAWAAIINKNDPEHFKKLMQINKSLMRKAIELNLKYPIPEGLEDEDAELFIGEIEEYRNFYEELEKEWRKLSPSPSESDSALKDMKVYLAELKQKLWDNFFLDYKDKVGEILSEENKFSVRKEIPLLDKVNSENLFAEENVSEYICYPFSNKQQPDYALKISDDSMAGIGIKNGDIVFIRGTDWADFNGQIVVAVINNNPQGVLRRIKWSEDSPVIKLVSENNSYEDINTMPNEMQICGTYMGYFRPCYLEEVK